MCIALYCPGCMGIEIVINFPAFFVIVDFMFAHNLSLRPRYGQYKVKLSHHIVY